MTSRTFLNLLALVGGVIATVVAAAVVQTCIDRNL